MKKLLTLIFLFLALSNCQFSKSAKKDLLSGLSSTGDKLSCDEVYITVNGERTTRKTFTYGETFIINFDNVTGFTKENGNVFPSMIMTVVSASGDTAMQTADLITDYPDGMNFSPLQLTADLTIATPIRSKAEYSVIVNIRDKKGMGTYRSKFDFKVIENDKVAIESSKASYNEAYVFSQGTNKVITDGKIKFNDNIYLIVEGLKGFNETGGMIFPGMSIKASDSANKVLIESTDLFTEYSATGVSAADLAERISAHFSIPGTQFNNPLHCEMTIWDKKSDAKLKLTTDLVLE